MTTGLGNLLAGVLWEGLGPLLNETTLNLVFAALMLVDAMVFLHICYTFQHAPSQVGSLDVVEEEGKGGGGVELNSPHGIDSYTAPAVTHELAHVAALEDL